MAENYAHIPVMKRLMAIVQRPRGVYPHLPKKHYRRQWKSAGIFNEPWRSGAFAVSGDKT